MLIPCNGCIACCRGSALLEIDELEKFETMNHGSWIGTALKDGWCVYVDKDKGCLVHDDKPRLCADYDCRDDVDNMSICRSVREAGRILLEKGEE